jgi:hypothetical protein
MNNINKNTEALKYLCAFIMIIRPALKTLEKICELLAEKKIKVDMMQLQSQESGDDRLLIHCEIERDRITYILKYIEKIPGVQTTDWMYSRVREKRY